MSKGRTLSLFRGLCPVRVPSQWVSDPDKVRWAFKGKTQFIDFRANGGKCLAFSITGSTPHCEEVQQAESLDWFDVEHGGAYVEPFVSMQVFGSSSQVIDLVGPEPDDGVRIVPPAIVEAHNENLEDVSFEIDTSVPVLYWSEPDDFGGCGYFYACVRSTNGKAVIGMIGMYQVPWRHPRTHLYSENARSYKERFKDEEVTYEEFIKRYPSAQNNPAKAWNMNRKAHFENAARYKMTDLFTI